MQVFSIRNLSFFLGSFFNIRSKNPENNPKKIIFDYKFDYELIKECPRGVMVKVLDLGGGRGVMVIVVGNGHGDTSSNPGQDW